MKLNMYILKSSYCNLSSLLQKLKNENYIMICNITFNTNMKMSKVTNAMKKQIAGRQRFKCNNKPGSNLKGLENYECPLWLMSNDKGSFDATGYEIDHIIEWSLTQTDNLINLQALCSTCHKMKAKNFIMNNKCAKNISITSTTCITDNHFSLDEKICFDEHDIHIKSNKNKCIGFIYLGDERKNIGGLHIFQCYVEEIEDHLRHEFVRHEMLDFYCDLNSIVIGYYTECKNMKSFFGDIHELGEKEIKMFNSYLIITTCSIDTGCDMIKKIANNNVIHKIEISKTKKSSNEIKINIIINTRLEDKYIYINENDEDVCRLCGILCTLRSHCSNRYWNIIGSWIGEYPEDRRIIPNPDMNIHVSCVPVCDECFENYDIKEDDIIYVRENKFSVEYYSRANDC